MAKVSINFLLQDKTISTEKSNIEFSCKVKTLNCQYNCTLVNM